MRISQGVWIARVLLVLVAILVLLPVVYQVGLSLKPESQIFASLISPLVWPPTLENYRVVLDRLPMDRYLMNTLLFAGGVTLGQVGLAILAAYAFSFHRFPFREELFALVLISLMVPFVVTYLPNYLLVAQWGLLNTLAGLILPMLTPGYGIFLLRQQFRGFPHSIVEAARVDGAGGWQVLWKVLVPANLSAIAALTVYLFIGAWNQFVWPALVANQPKVQVLTVAVQRFASSEGGDSWGALMAAATLATLPALTLYLVMRRAILKTLLEGGVQG